MSYYLLHILNEGCSLRKERGNLVCAYRQDSPARKIALEDVRGIIIAARDVVYTDAVIAAVLAKGGFILHANNRYQPVGITAPLARLNKSSTVLLQAKAGEAFNRQLWEKLIKKKVANQASVLGKIKEETGYLKEQLKKAQVNESSCARYYWRTYFDSLGYDELTRRGDSEHKVNGMLNYGYAVLAAICHRSLVAHGLSPLFGICHKPGFHGSPLVYDVVEPWRPFLDALLHHQLSEDPALDIKSWVAFSSRCWESAVVISDKNTQKLVDAMDYYMSTLVSAYEKQKVSELWLPEMTFVGQ